MMGRFNYLFYGAIFTDAHILCLLHPCAQQLVFLSHIANPESNCTAEVMNSDCATICSTNEILSYAALLILCSRDLVDDQ